MERAIFNGKVIDIISVSSTDSSEFDLLKSTLSHISVVGLDAEWKPQPHGTPQPNFPYICLLQIACLSNISDSNSVVFLLDLLMFHPPSIPKVHELLKGMFESPNILKLGFRFKQDFMNLSSTFQFQLQGWDLGFDRVDPHLDIFKIYNHIRALRRQPLSEQIKKLTDICEEILGYPLSKEQQCSDWSDRPLTKEQKEYAAIDAYCLIEIFNVYQAKVPDDNLLQIVSNYGDNIVLKESDRKPKTSEMKNKGQAFVRPVSKGPRPWDCSLGGDGQPKFLCGAMVVGLARMLRVAGIDTEIVDCTDGCESSCIEDQIKQAQNEGRILITREAKHGKHDCLNYYRLRSRRKDDQFTEVFKTFQLEKTKGQIYRCTQCNKGFKLFWPLTTEEAIEAAKGYSFSCWCTPCQDRYGRYLYLNEKGERRIDYIWVDFESY